MGVPTDGEMATIMANFAERGLRVISIDHHRHYGRMITVVVDEGDPDKVTVFEIWPEGFTARELVDAAISAREANGAGLVYTIGENPRLLA
jgi:hypothetical protein